MLFKTSTQFQTSNLNFNMSTLYSGHFHPSKFNQKLQRQKLNNEAYIMSIVVSTRNLEKLVKLENLFS